MKPYGIFIVLTAFLCSMATVAVRPEVSYAQNGQDNATDAVYNPTWDTGDNGGSGLQPWTLGVTGSAGHFIWTSTANGNGDDNLDGDIDVLDEAWGIWANSGGTGEAFRPFSAVVPADWFVQIEMDNGWIDGGSVGTGLQNASSENLCEFYFVAAASYYTINDAGGTFTTTIPFTDEGLILKWSIQTGGTYDLEVTDLFSGTVYPFPGRTMISPAGGQNVEQIHLWNWNAGGGDERNAYWNSLVVDQLSPVTEWEIY